MTGKTRMSLEVFGTNAKIDLEERSRSRSKKRHEEMYAKTDLFER